MVKRSKTSFFCRGSRGFVFEELCAAGASPRWGHRDEKREYGPMVKRSETSFFCRGSRGFVFEELCAAGASPRWGHRDEKREYGPMVKRSETSFFCRGSRGFVFEELCAAGASPRWGRRDEKREYGPMVKRSKTSPFHGGNPGSSPGGVTKLELSEHHYHRKVGSGSFFIAAKGIDIFKSRVHFVICTRLFKICNYFNARILLSIPFMFS